MYYIQDYRKRAINTIIPYLIEFPQIVSIIEQSADRYQAIEDVIWRIANNFRIDDARGVFLQALAHNEVTNIIYTDVANDAFTYGTDKPEYQGVTDVIYNRFVFRVPTLGDAIRQERHFSDSIGFWRRIGMDCLVAIQHVEDGEVTDTLPQEFHTWYGLKIFNEYLYEKDLREIRNALIDYLPTLPFAYYEPCGCDEQREIPMTMEASNFFSE